MDSLLHIETKNYVDVIHKIWFQETDFNIMNE